MKKYTEPLFFAHNRVWRCYLGGELLDLLMTGRPGCDCNYPENWLGSVTRADNGVHQTSPEEGLARLRDDGETLVELLRRDSRTVLGSESGDLGVLCKFLDAAIRLPIQCHPDRELARKFWGSEYGKTESWFILNTREINGQKPYILFGFKPGVERAAFERAVAEQDIPALTGMLHKVEVKPGEVYLIPGRLPHAIGSGVLMLEVQEPTDLVIQPERRIGDLTLSDRDMWGALTPEQGLACFDCTGVEREELLSRLRLRPELEWERDGAKFYRIIDRRHTECFRVRLLTVAPGARVCYALDSPWQLGIVVAGSGELRAGSPWRLESGDSFLLPNPVREVTFSALDQELRLYLVG